MFNHLRPLLNVIDVLLFVSVGDYLLAINGVDLSTARTTDELTEFIDDLPLGPVQLVVFARPDAGGNVNQMRKNKNE